MKPDIEKVEDTEKTKRERFIREQLTNKSNEEDTTKEKTVSVKHNSALNLSTGIITKYKKQDDEGLLIKKLSSSDKNISPINKISQMEHKKGSISELGIYPDSSADESMVGKLESQFDLFNILFTSNNYKKIEDGKPVIICLKEMKEDNYIGTLRRICEAVYREKKGGNPKSIIITDIKEFKDELRWIEAENKIYTICLAETDWNNIEKSDWERLSNRFFQLHSQDTGFLILNTQIYSAPEPHRINFVYLEPRLLNIEIKRELIQLIWGDADIIKTGSFDEIFEDAKQKYENLLENIGIEKEGLYADATNLHENESKLHLFLKWFIVRFLTEKLKSSGNFPEKLTPDMITRKVKTESYFGTNSKGDGVIPDIDLGADVFEVETLFAEDRGGKIFRNKINETIKKYEGTDARNINIVLENFTLLRHLKALDEIKKNHINWEKKERKKINFFTIDIQNKNLIHRDELIPKIKYIYDRLKL